jgi:hypothetical protein
MTDTTLKTARRFPWLRWLRFWLISALLLGLMPVAVTGAYYLLKPSSDFGPGLLVFQPEKPAWALRVGSASCERPGLAIVNRSFGVNAYSPSFDRAQSKVWNRDLYGTYQATYVGWFPTDVLPEVFTVSRDVGQHGDISYAAWRNGTKPIAKYAFFSLTLGGLAVFFFVIVGSKKPTV